MQKSESIIMGSKSHEYMQWKFVIAQFKAKVGGLLKINPPLRDFSLLAQS